MEDLDTLLTRLKAAYAAELLVSWLTRAEAAYLKLKERQAKPKRVNVNKVLAGLDEADLTAIKQLLRG